MPQESNRVRNFISAQSKPILLTSSLLAFVGSTAFILEFIYFPAYKLNSTQQVIVQSTIFLLFASIIMAVLAYPYRNHRKTERQARERLRSAEDNLAVLLARNDPTSLLSKGLGEVTSANRSGAAQEDRLTLSALWEVTHSRLDLYHQIATDQARRSFVTAQVAIAIGFILLACFAVLSFRSHTVVGAATTAALGTVSAALAGYIGRTFIRSQESSAIHLRAYFDQPLEFSRFLAAERLLANQVELDAGQRVELLSALIGNIVKTEERIVPTNRRNRKGQ